MDFSLAGISIQQIIVFLCVAEYEGFAKASDYLHMTQSAVSKSVAKMEKELGIELFQRTTREEQIQIGGIGLNVIDTAGIRDTEDIVEKIGVNKSREYIEKADLIIYVVDSSTELDENDQEIIEAIQNKKAIVLLNKSDLDAKTDASVLQTQLSKPILSISAKNNTGIHELETLIEEMFFSGKLSFNDEVYITNIRQKNALAEAQNSLKMVLQSIADGMPEDFFTIDMMNAYEALGTIIGESVGEDLVNEIFSKFCMGK